LTRTALVVLAGVFLPAAVLGIGGRGLSSAVRQLRCYYDLDAVRSAMTFLQEDSRPGDIVFTDDWDIFPPFFYYNRHNHFIVGLDPKFTHQRDPDLWNRYVKISRGQVPATIRLASTTEDADRATVALDDIRTHFRARYVVADRDHRALSDALHRAPELAELVYPASDYEEAREAPYVIFRMRDPGQAPALARGPDENGAAPVFLSELRPLSVVQGWGDLAADGTVDGNPIRLDGRTYARGVGTHAPARILYEIPAGHDWFEATIGVDDETGGRGSVVASVLLDGRTVYETPELRGGGKPVVARIRLEGARQIELQAGATADGQRFDHVCWADARLIPGEKGGQRRDATSIPAGAMGTAAGRGRGTDSAAGRGHGTDSAAGRGHGTDSAAGGDSGTEAAAAPRMDTASIHPRRP
jgi:hypothetical protein